MDGDLPPDAGMEPLPGEEFAEVDALEELVNGIRALTAMHEQQLEVLGAQMRLLEQINTRLGPKRVLRDERGQVIGAVPIGE